jgi:4-hydroxy-tetrahydrodipicolinate synthase
VTSSTKPFRPSGMYVASVTPFREDETLDLDRLGSHLQYLIDAGVDGIVVLGGSGEYVNLTADERRAVIACARQVIAKRIPLVVGALGPSTHEALDVARDAARAEADALLVLPPYYIRASTEGVVEHFARVAEAGGLPVIVYNNPPRTGWAIEMDLLERLASVPGVVGLKDCDRDVAQIAAKIASVGDRISILSGDDDLGFATLVSGGPGAIWATANLAPRLCVELARASLKGDLEKARPLAERLRQLVHVRRIPNHPGPMKEMMAMVGRPVGPARRPLVAMTEAQRTRVRAVLESLAPVV